jgi:hypothetical protein
MSRLRARCLLNSHNTLPFQQVARCRTTSESSSVFVLESGSDQPLRVHVFLSAGLQNKPAGRNCGQITSVHLNHVHKAWTWKVGAVSARHALAVAGTASGWKDSRNARKGLHCMPVPCSGLTQGIAYTISLILIGFNLRYTTICCYISLFAVIVIYNYLLSKSSMLTRELDQRLGSLDQIIVKSVEMLEL